MAGGYIPNYIQFLVEEEIHDQVQQFIDDQEGVIEVDDDDDDSDTDDDDDDDDSDTDDEEEEESDDGDDANPVSVVALPRVPVAVPSSSSQEEVILRRTSEDVAEDENEDVQRREEGAKASSHNDEVGGGENCSGAEWSRSDVDGLYCPICMEAWSNGGDHQICCLPCGHLYGLSCIKRWIQQRRSSGKCPQCNKKCTLKDVRVLYASQIVAVDQEVQKKLRSLEAKCVYLEKKDVDWCKKEVEWHKGEADLRMQLRQLTERTSYLECQLGDTQSKLPGLFTASGGCHEQAIFGHNLDPELGRQGSSRTFVLQKELQLDGARFFDIDASSRVLIVARRLSGMGGTHVLTKMSLIAPHEGENIQLPVSTKAIRDLRVSPHGRLALLASLGKKLSVLSLESNNIILAYDLPAAAWSCAWDLNSSHYIYAGLQNGMLLMFDMRQTMRPVESMIGLTCNPIHAVFPLSPNSSLPCGVRNLLTASSVGLSQWNFGGNGERPILIPESENQGVCISLACSAGSDDIVASFRPKVEISSDLAVSQAILTPPTSLVGQVVQGSHVVYRRVGSRGYQKLGSTCANVNDIRLPKSIIMERENQSPLFASGDEVTGELVLQELPSLMVVQHLKSRKHPIRDVKYTQALSSGLLSCLREDKLQLFSPSLL